MILPFWKWKQQEIDRSGVFMPRIWYYQMYGTYCKEARKAERSEVRQPGLTKEGGL